MSHSGFLFSQFFVFLSLCIFVFLSLCLIAQHCTAVCEMQVQARLVNLYLYFVFLYFIVVVVLCLSLSDSSLLCVSCRSRQGAGELANEGFEGKKVWQPTRSSIEMVISKYGATPNHCQYFPQKYCSNISQVFQLISKYRGTLNGCKYLRCLKTSKDPLIW